MEYDTETTLANAPRRWVICGECDGEGTSSAYLGSFSRADLDEDPDFVEDYFAGQYDRACPACRGTGKIKTIVYELCTPEQQAELDAEAEYDAERAAEMRMRERGIQF